MAFRSQLSNEPPFSVSLSQGGRIKHVLNVGAMHFDRDKLMCGRRCSPKQGAGRRRVLMTDSVNFILPLSRIKKYAEGHLTLN